MSEVHKFFFFYLILQGRIFAAPFFHVGFADFWLADQLNSLTAAFLDFHFVFCFYLTNEDWVVPQGAFLRCVRVKKLKKIFLTFVFYTHTDVSHCVSYAYFLRPVVHCLPAWFRFAQCLRRYYDSREGFPHLVNALKYSTTFFVVLFTFLRAKYKGD